jgi:hypothetical protein
MRATCGPDWRREVDRLVVELTGIKLTLAHAPVCDQMLRGRLRQEAAALEARIAAAKRSTMTRELS